MATATKLYRLVLAVYGISIVIWILNVIASLIFVGVYAYRHNLGPEEILKRLENAQDRLFIRQYGVTREDVYGNITPRIVLISLIVLPLRVPEFIEYYYFLMKNFTHPEGL